MTVIPSDRTERRHQRRRLTDKTVGTPPTKPSEPPAAVIGADAPTELTETEQLLLDTGFRQTTARAFSGFDYEAVRSELHRQDLLAWLPREDRDRRIGMLVMRWRRVKPEIVRESDVGTQETAAARYALREEALAPMQDELEPLELCEEEPLDPWTERARRLRPQWTSGQQGALARALRHAPNDAAALVMAQVTMGVAQRC